MASFEILLISVRSETPTSFFLVVSKTAFFANWDGGAPPPVSFLRPARFDTYVRLQSVHCTLHYSECVVLPWVPWLVPNCRRKFVCRVGRCGCGVCCDTRGCSYQ